MGEEWRESGRECIKSIEEEIDYLIQCMNLRERIIKGGTENQYDRVVPLIKQSIMSLHFNKLRLISIAAQSGHVDEFREIVNGLNEVIPMAILTVEEGG